MLVIHSQVTQGGSITPNPRDECLFKVTGHASTWHLLPTRSVLFCKIDYSDRLLQGYR